MKSDVRQSTNGKIRDLIEDAYKRELAEFVLMESPVEGVAGFEENILERLSRPLLNKAECAWNRPYRDSYLHRLFAPPARNKEPNDVEKYCPALCVPAKETAWPCPAVLSLTPAKLWFFRPRRG